MSPDGSVPTFKSEYWDTGSTDSENGVYEVAATAPGTFAETGLVHDTRPGHEVPVEGASVTYESVLGRGLSTPPGGAVQVTTKTGDGGAFAFIDMPVARGGSCYRLVITAPGLGTYEAIDVIEAGVYDHSGLELDGRRHRESIPLEYPTVAKHAPPLYRACAAQGSR